MTKIFEAATRKGKYKFIVWDNDGWYSFKSFKYDVCTGGGVLYDKNNLITRVKNELIYSKMYDNINYLVTLDTLKLID